MPTIIDRYMLRQFVQVLVICFMSLAGLYIVIDAFGHLDHFVDYADKHGNLLATMGTFYAYRTLAFFEWTSGILALTAAMFTVTWIQRHHEMTALLAAGVPRLRVLRPVLIAAIAVSFLAVANRELMIPSARQQLALDSKNLGGDNEAELKSRFDSQSDILLGGDSIVAAEKKIIRPSFMLPPGLDDFGRQLTAHSAQFVAAEGDRPSGYLLSGVTAPRPLLSQPTRKIGEMPVIVTPHDAKWLAEDQVFVVSGVSFEFLSAGSNWRDHASTRELIHELRSPSTDLGADVRYAIHSRLMQPFLDTTLLFLGLPLIISKGNRNPFIAIGMCVAVVALFMTIRLGCQSLCLTGWLQAPFAAWLPLMIFAPLAVLMAEPLRQ